MHYGPQLELLGFCWVFARLLASSMEFIGCDVEVSPLPPPLVAVEVAYPHYSACLLSQQLAVFSHNLVPRAGTIGLECEYYFIVGTKSSQWLLCNLVNQHFFPVPHMVPMASKPENIGSLRINCLLTSHLITKQVRVDPSRASYFLCNLEASEIYPFQSVLVFGKMDVQVCFRRLKKFKRQLQLIGSGHLGAKGKIYFSHRVTQTQQRRVFTGQNN